METIPFTYILKFKPTNQYYYGVKYSKGSKPSDLWNTYFTSSSRVKKLIEEFGINSFDYKITKTFSNKIDAIEWEIRFQTKVKADKNAKFLNKRIWKNPYSAKGMIVINNPLTKETTFHDPKIKIPEGFLLGQLPSHKENLSKSMKGRIPYNKGKKCKPTGACTEERKNNISESRLKTKKIKCDFCNKETDPGNFKQYHGDSCKLNPNINKDILNKRSIKAKKAIEVQKEKGTYKRWKQPEGPFTCDICGKIGNNYGAMKRLHFERCKFKEN